MCTVSYLPLAEGGCIITSNRDENRLRAAERPASIDSERATLLFPKDPASGGSWICASADGRIVCLLNGAFIKHKHLPPYRRSRGLVVLDIFNYKNYQDFLQSYDLKGIEPFTIVLKDSTSLTELRWDGTKKHIKVLDITEAYLWASATLYDETIVSKRRAWFKEWLKSQDSYSVDSIMHWHRNTGDGDAENDLVMNRDNIVETISITSVHNQNATVKMHHLDLLEEAQAEFSF